MKKIIGFTFMALMLLGCTGPKALTKKGMSFQEAGYHNDAINYFIMALNKDKTHMDALNGLKRSANEVISEKTSKFFQAYNSSDYKNTVYLYFQMEDFINRVNKYKADIQIPDTYKNDFLNAKQIYSENLFEEANNLLANDQFAEAEEILKELRSINPSYKEGELKELKIYSKVEPRYRSGKDHMLKEEYRAAYYEFEFITTLDKDYKDAAFLMEEALKKAQFNIAVYEFKNASSVPNAEERIRSKLIDKMVSNDNPFVKLIDRQMMDNIVNEQMLALDGIVNQQTAIKIGEIMGAQAVLVGNVLDFNSEEGKLETETKRAYLESRVKRFNAELKRNVYETIHRKVTYNEHKIKNKASLSFNFQLISLETGQIIFSKTVSKINESKAEYASYNGNYKSLVPGTWESKSYNSPNDRIFNNRNTVAGFRSQFNNSKEPAPIETVVNQLYYEVVDEVIKELVSFNP